MICRIKRIDTDMASVTYREAALATMICAMPIAFAASSLPPPQPPFTIPIRQALSTGDSTLYYV